MTAGKQGVDPGLELAKEVFDYIQVRRIRWWLENLSPTASETVHDLTHSFAARLTGIAAVRVAC